MQRAFSLTLPPDPVLLRNNLGRDVQIAASDASELPGNVQSSTSIKEAVRIAQENNFMGLICNLRLLVSIMARGQYRLLSLTTCVETGTSTDRDDQGCRTGSCCRYLWAAFAIARCTAEN